EATAELVHAVTAQGIDELVHERLGRQIKNTAFRRAVEDLMPNGVHEVRLPQANTAVDEEWVVVVTGEVGDRLTRSMSKLIAPADDEVVERVFGEQGRRSPLANRRGAAGEAHREREQLLLGRCRCLNEHAGWGADGLGEHLFDDPQITVAHQVDGELIW